MSYLFGLSIFIAIIIFIAISTKKKRLRILLSFFVYLLLLLYTDGLKGSALRYVLGSAVESDTYTQDFRDGAIALGNALTPGQTIIFICGTGLFLISIYNRSTKK